VVAIDGADGVRWYVKIRRRHHRRALEDALQGRVSNDLAVREHQRRRGLLRRPDRMRSIRS
jgi:hypothetical protein